MSDILVFIFIVVPIWLVVSFVVVTITVFLLGLYRLLIMAIAGLYVMAFYFIWTSIKRVLRG